MHQLVHETSLFGDNRSYDKVFETFTDATRNINKTIFVGWYGGNECTNDEEGENSEERGLWPEKGIEFDRFIHFWRDGADKCYEPYACRISKRVSCIYRWKCINLLFFSEYILPWTVMEKGFLQCSYFAGSRQFVYGFLSGQSLAFSRNKCNLNTKLLFYKGEVVKKYVIFLL
jgi:hypothetical protein